MDWQAVATRLFGQDHAVVADGDFLAGSALFDGAPIAIVGTTNHAAVGVDLALRQARAVLEVVEHHPGRPLLLLVDTQGQKLRRRDELLGIHRAMAHLGCCVDLARRSGHPVIGLVYDQALSGGFITSGLVADACHALPEALLESLSLTNPVFAPGVANYVAMGGVRSLWDGDLAAGLRAALADRDTSDRRAVEGAQRGGRRVAADVIRRVLEVW